MEKLKKESVWVCWKRDKEKGKIPKNPRTGGNAQSNNPSTWSTYDEAINATKRYNFDGVGFMFTGDICGIDIDKATSPELTQQADNIITHMNSYCERSPSGEGYHIIFRCDRTKIPQKKGKLDSAYYQKNPKNGVECYIAGFTNRFFTYTGNVVKDLRIYNRTDELLEFLEKYMKKSISPVGGLPIKKSYGDSISEDDNRGVNIKHNMKDIFSIIRKSKKGKKFISLFDNGDISAYGNDDSAADLGLCNILAFFFEGDFDSIDAAFRQSKLMRSKWERTDYRTATINKSIEGCGGNFYKHRINKTSIEKKVIEPRYHVGAVYINPFETLENRQRYSWSDIGMGRLFADTYTNLCKYVPESKNWYIYTNGIWKEDVGNALILSYAIDFSDYLMDCKKYISEIDEMLRWKKFTFKYTTVKGLENIISIARAINSLNFSQFDKNPFLFNCKNCTLDLKNFKVKPHNPNDYITKTSNVIFDPDSKSERWDSFIHEVMSGDMEKAAFLQKAIGYSLTGDTSKECLFVLFGSTSRNGKSTVIETISHILGDYSTTIQPETLMQKTRDSGTASDDLAKLRGARFVNMSEPDKGLKLNASLVKQMTGNDTITARFLYQKSFTYTPEYKLFINTNYLPRVTDEMLFKSGRIQVIPFERHFTREQQDNSLKKIFRTEENMSAIFNWCLKGIRLLDREGLEQPQAVFDATTQYMDESDTVGIFIKECLVPIRSLKTPFKDIYTVYENWCRDYGYSPYNSGNLAKELRKKSLEIKNGTNNKVCIFDYGVRTDEDPPKGSQPLFFC